MVGNVNPTSMLPAQLTRATTGTAAVRGPCVNSSGVMSLDEDVGGQNNHVVNHGLGSVILNDWLSCKSVVPRGEEFSKGN